MVRPPLMPVSHRRPAATATRRAALLVAAAALAAPAGAGAAKQPSIYQSKLLWATVNVCDTPKHPATVGIRGSMPGSGSKGETMHMRFQLQYFDQVTRVWHNLAATADSGFVQAGEATYRQRQTGRNFVVTPPASGVFILRGAVTFEWRDEDGEVVRRARKRTSAKHGGTVGAEPRGYSAARCRVRKKGS